MSFRPTDIRLTDSMGSLLLAGGAGGGSPTGRSSTMASALGGSAASRRLSVGGGTTPHRPSIGGRLSSSTAVAAAPRLLTTMLKLLFEREKQTIFNAETGLLQLNSMKGNAKFTAASSAVGGGGGGASGPLMGLDLSTSASCAALCQAIVDVFGASTIDFLSLDGNGIHTPAHLVQQLDHHGLSHALKGLSLRDNDVKTLDFLRKLKPERFPRLIELHLGDNPVAAMANYLSSVREMLPNLLGLDGKGVQARALALPWPVSSPPPPSEQLAELQRNVETALFRDMSGALDVDTFLAPLYNDYSVWSLSIEEGAEVKLPPVPSSHPRRNEVAKDYCSLRIAQTERDANLLRKRGLRCVRGAVNVVSAIQHTLYPKEFDVCHRLCNDHGPVLVLPSKPAVDPATNPTPKGGVHPPAVLLEAAALLAADLATVVLTFHGAIEWRSKRQSSDVHPVVRHFDRTVVVLVDRATGAPSSISRDSMHLRVPLLTAIPAIAAMTTGTGANDATPSGRKSIGGNVEKTLLATADLTAINPLLFPTDPARIARLCRIYDGMDERVIVASVQSCGSDVELSQCLAEISTLQRNASSANVAQWFDECAALPGVTDPRQAIVILRVMARWPDVSRVTTRVAYDLLENAKPSSDVPISMALANYVTGVTAATHAPTAP